MLKLNPTRKGRLGLVLFLLTCTSLAVFLVVKALQTNINLFFTPTQVIQGEAPKQKRIRVGGMVEKGSLVRGPQLQVQFVITDFTQRLTIQYSGILPDLFREGQGIVALGEVTGNSLFQANEILAKHDENYMPPEIKNLAPTKAGSKEGNLKL